MTQDNARNVVRVATAANAAQAHIWAEALEDEGIKCKVVGDYLDAGLGDIPGVRAELWVHESDAARAADLLAAHEQAQATARDEEE
jgi:hypothetical protein